MTTLKDVNQTIAAPNFYQKSSDVSQAKPGVFLPNINRAEVRVEMIEEIDIDNDLSNRPAESDLLKTQFVTPKHQTQKIKSPVTSEIKLLNPQTN